MNWYSRKVLAGPYALNNVDWRHVRERAEQGATKKQVAEELGLRYYNFFDTFQKKKQLEPAWQKIDDQFKENFKQYLSHVNKLREKPNTMDMVRKINWPAVAKLILRGVSVREIAQRLKMPFVTLGRRIWRELINQQSPSYNAEVAKFLGKSQTTLPSAADPWSLEPGGIEAEEPAPIAAE